MARQSAFLGALVLFVCLFVCCCCCCCCKRREARLLRALIPFLRFVCCHAFLFPVGDKRSAQGTFLLFRESFTSFILFRFLLVVCFYSLQPLPFCVRPEVTRVRLTGR